MSFLFNAGTKHINAGLLILRLGIGFAFIYWHGLKKITGGSETWIKYGKNMQYLGVDFGYEFWGLMAGFAETFGGFLILIGLLTRPAAFLIAFVMVVAIMKNMNEGQLIAYPVEMLVVMVTLLITGPGRYSLDSRIR